MQHVDFLPERIKAQRRRRRRIAKQTYMLAICLAGLAVLGYTRNGRVAIVRAELAQLGAREADNNLQLQRLVDLEREKAGLYVIQRIDEKLGSRLSTYLMLSDFESLVREPMTLTQLSVETMDVSTSGDGSARINSANRPRSVGLPAGSGTTVKRVRLTLTGLAREDVDVANFIGQMSACPLFRNVNMGYSRNVKIKDRTARQFQVSCYVVH